MAKILIINGPNLNLLGVREPHIYGTETLESIANNCKELATTLGHEIEFFQSNAEAEIIERLHQHFSTPVDYIIINPAAFTHTSVAIRDAISATNVPFVEVHLSNVHQREPFRQHSYFSDLATGVICGLGSQGYLFAIQYIDQALKQK
ncbi:type II 3-dehydroquinate dehydratase [Gynuella sp.]|uniref:type II 3-dehydroquinate dehydratase n=1 Tax=Gynuella sp. TaxID=2969146 RepID=UPI003D0C4B43